MNTNELICKVGDVSKHYTYDSALEEHLQDIISHMREITVQNGMQEILYYYKFSTCVIIYPCQLIQ